MIKACILFSATCLVLAVYICITAYGHTENNKSENNSNAN